MRPQLPLCDRYRGHDGGHSALAGLVKAKARSAQEVGKVVRPWLLICTSPPSCGRYRSGRHDLGQGLSWRSCGYRHAHAAALRPPTALASRHSDLPRPQTWPQLLRQLLLLRRRVGGSRRGHSYAAVHSMRHAPRIVDNAMQLPATARAFHHGDPGTAEAVPHSQRQAQAQSCGL